MQKFVPFFVIFALAGAATAAAAESQGAANLKSPASMPATAQPAAPIAVKLAAPSTVPEQTVHSVAPSAASLAAPTTLHAAMPTVSPAAPTALHSAMTAPSPAASAALHSAMATASPVASPSAASPSSSPNLADAKPLTLRDTLNASVRPRTAGLAAPAINHDAVAAHANLTTERQATPLHLGAMLASDAHTSRVAAANALPNKQGNVSAAMRPISGASLQAKIRHQ